LPTTAQRTKMRQFTATWKDYYNYGLALPDSPSGIDRFCQIHLGYAGGARKEFLIFFKHDGFATT